MSSCFARDLLSMTRLLSTLINRVIRFESFHCHINEFNTTIYIMYIEENHVRGTPLLVLRHGQFWVAGSSPYEIIYYSYP